jgi:preprotein translocase subunit YajC
LDAAKQCPAVTVADPAYIVCKGGLRRYSPRRFGAGVPTEAEESPLMFITEAFAQTGAASSSSSLILQFAPILLIFVIMYFLILRPNQQKAKVHREMVANLRRGDTVVTSGGLIGKVAKVDEGEIQVELAEGVRVRVVRGSISEVRAKGEPVKDAG